jgi:hypothetical protein
VGHCATTSPLLAISFVPTLLKVVETDMKWNQDLVVDRNRDLVDRNWDPVDRNLDLVDRNWDLVHWSRNLEVVEWNLMFLVLVIFLALMRLMKFFRRILLADLKLAATNG